MNIYDKLVDKLVTSGAHQAVLFLSPTRTVKATRKRYGGSKGRPNRRTLEIILTDGAPNYWERRFIRDCKKAGEPFPVKKVQLRRVA